MWTIEKSGVREKEKGLKKIEGRGDEKRGGGGKKRGRKKKKRETKKKNRVYSGKKEKAMEKVGFNNKRQG